MALEFLLDPVSDDAPCGEDLNASMDPEYDEYYFEALARIPSFYFQPGVERPDGSRTPDRIFDVKEIDYPSEEKQIDALLKRTRDIRLLTLRLQFSLLAGRIKPAADSFKAIADVIETFGDDALPNFDDGVSERRDAINDLVQQVSILQPLQFLDLAGNGAVSLRKVGVANGQFSALESEDDINLSAMMETLGSPSYRKKVDETHAALLTISEALSTISSKCQVSAKGPFSPALDPVKKVVADILELIGSARSDLRSLADTAVSEEGEDEDLAEGEEGEVSEDGATPVRAAAPEPLPEGAVSNHTQATAYLAACEAYYRRFEPSSAALPLITQAKLLIGKPLIEALETLLPDHASQALVEFGPKNGFVLHIDRLRQLTIETDGAGQGFAEDDVAEPEITPFTTPAEAAGAIQSVEDFFRKREKSSPIPVLLQRARSYLNKDFQSLIDELIPVEPQ